MKKIQYTAPAIRAVCLRSEKNFVFTGNSDNNEKPIDDGNESF